jgi:hypothetical protein
MGEDDRQPYPDTDAPEDEGIAEMEGPPDRQRETSDSPEGLVLPRDEPRAADAHGATAEEQREGEPLGERLREEDHDAGPATHRQGAGRLVDEDVTGVDAEKDLVADEAEEDDAGLSAEEAAMRKEDRPPGATEHPDDYVEGERPR